MVGRVSIRGLIDILGCSEAKTERIGACFYVLRESHQEVGMAQDLCPRFMDYLGMGHFYHKVRVPGREGEKGEGEKEGRGRDGRGGPWR
jgi:hypothetical protein